MDRSGQPTGQDSAAIDSAAIDSAAIDSAAVDSAATNELRRLAEETSAGCCLAVEPVVVHGNPSIEILSEAFERHASLIVLGATHRSAFENLTRERTIYRVLAHARCPVLTLREPQAMAAEGTAERVAAFHG